MAKILNIETSTRICSVALGEDDRILARREKRDTVEHAKVLHLFIEEIMQEQDITFHDLSAVAVSEGPGSYTGLRIGVSAAKGICYGANIPLIAVSTLQAMAIRAAGEMDEKEALYIPMIDARRMEVYTAVFDDQGRKKQNVSAEIIHEESFKNLLPGQKIYFGDGATKCRQVFSKRPDMLYFDGGWPAAHYMQLSAKEKFEKHEFQDVAYFEPFYLKDFIAGKPKVKGLDS